MQNLRKPLIFFHSNSLKIEGLGTEIIMLNSSWALVKKEARWVFVESFGPMISAAPS